MTSLHTSWTPKGYKYRVIEGGPVLFTVTYISGENGHIASKPWVLHETQADKTRFFKTREGAEFFALYLQAEVG